MSHSKSILALLAIVLFLAACAAKPVQESVMNQWVGKDISKLKEYKAWKSSFQGSVGDTAHVFMTTETIKAVPGHEVKNEDRQVVAVGPGSDQFKVHVRRIFITNKNQEIIRWRIETLPVQ